MYCCYTPAAIQAELVVPKHQVSPSVPEDFHVKKTHYRPSRADVQQQQTASVVSHKLEPEPYPVMAPRFGYFSPRGGYPMTSPYLQQQLSPRAAPGRVNSIRSNSSFLPSSPRPKIEVSYVPNPPEHVEVLGSPTPSSVRIQVVPPSKPEEPSVMQHRSPPQPATSATSPSHSPASGNAESNLPAKVTVEEAPLATRTAENEVVSSLEATVNDEIEVKPNSTEEPPPVPAAAVEEVPAEDLQENDADAPLLDDSTEPLKEPETPKATATGGASATRKLGSPKVAGKAGAKTSPRALGRAAGGEGGLMTRDRDKMTDLLDERDKRNLYTACNFVRETIESHPRDDPLVAERDKTFLLFMVLFAAKLGAADKQHSVNTAIAHAAGHAKGQIPTAKAKKAAPKVEFYLNRIAKPFLEYIAESSPKKDAAYTAKDIYDTARVSMGEPPVGLESRTDYLEAALKNWSLTKATELAKNDEQTFSDKWRTLVNAMDDYRKTGDGFIAIVDQVGKLIEP